GVPGKLASQEFLQLSSPRAWGCTVSVQALSEGGVVVPTRVGVYRLRRWPRFAVWGRPHARGGVPPASVVAGFAEPSSPRAWGCTGALDVREHPRPSSPRAWGCTA